MIFHLQVEQLGDSLAPLPVVRDAVSPRHGVEIGPGDLRTLKPRGHGDPVLHQKDLVLAGHPQVADGLRPLLVFQGQTRHILVVTIHESVPAHLP